MSICFWQADLIKDIGGVSLGTLVDISSIFYTEITNIPSIRSEDLFELAEIYSLVAISATNTLMSITDKWQTDFSQVATQAQNFESLSKGPVDTIIKMYCLSSFCELVNYSTVALAKEMGILNSLSARAIDLSCRSLGEIVLRRFNYFHLKHSTLSDLHRYMLSDKIWVKGVGGL